MRFLFIGFLALAAVFAASGQGSAETVPAP